MKYSEIVTQYVFNEKKLLKYGFIKQKNYYQFTWSLNQELEGIILIAKELFQVDVYEKETKEKYLPFYVKDAIGTYMSELYLKIENTIDDIKKYCFETIDFRNKIIAYVGQKYQTKPEYPWLDSPDAFTLKTNTKKKWYGLVMNVSYQTLGLKGTGKVDVINLKNTPDKIEKSIDQKHFFKAYHMNKKHWMTILLDNQLDMEELKKLIDESYQIVET